MPQRINEIFHYKIKNDGLPSGNKLVDSGRYSATWTGKNLGTYTTLKEAYNVHSKAKVEAIRKTANDYKEIIPIKLYNALLNYKDLIEYDPNYRVV